MKSSQKSKDVVISGLNTEMEKLRVDNTSYKQENIQYKKQITDL